MKNRYVQIVSKKLFDFGMGKAYKKYTACAYEKIDEIADVTESKWKGHIFVCL